MTFPLFIDTYTTRRLHPASGYLKPTQLEYLHDYPPFKIAA